MNKLTAATELENALGCGGYQVIVFITYQFSVFIQCFSMAFMSFGKVEPIVWVCNHDNTTVSNLSLYGNTEEKCRLFDNGSCTNIYWETDFHSIVTEWQLFCGRTGIVYLIISVQMTGVLVGSPIWGQLSDSFGRKWTLFASQLTLVLFNVLSTFSPNWETYLSFRFLLGLSCGGTICISFVFLTENLKARHRLWVTTAGGWPTAFTVFAGLAYATKDWKLLSFVTAASGIPTLLMIPVIPESPRWLLQKQKLDDAQKSLLRVMKWNCDKEKAESCIGPVISAFQEVSHPLRPASKQQRKKKYTYWHLCHTRKLAADLLVLLFAYVSVSVITYGIMMNNDKLMGDKYMNFFLFGAIRWVSSVLAPVLDTSIRSCGRKLMSSVAFAIICLATTTVSVIILFAPSVPGKVITGLVLVASAMVSLVWPSVNLVTVEAFPTPIRNITAGVAGVFTRLGAIIVPVFLYMARLWEPSPYVLFAIVSLLSSILCGLFLPETKNKPMPDAMPPRQKRWWCCCGDAKSLQCQKPRGTTRSDSFTVYQFSEENRNAN